MYILYKSLSQDSPKLVNKGSDPDSIEYVHGLGSINRFDKSKHTITKTVYRVPNIIVAYNKYMNNVDLVDQRRKTSYTQRKERKLYMNFFSLILDYAINNAYALYRWYHDMKNTPELFSDDSMHSGENEQKTVKNI